MSETDRPPPRPSGGPNVEIDLLEDADADVGRATVSGLDLSGRTFTGRAFDDVVFSGTRCTGTTFERCQFDTVVFRDCELSAVTFTECSLRELVIVGGKAASFVVVDDCGIDDVWITDMALGDLSISSCAFRGPLVIAASKASEVAFARCRATGNRASVVISEFRAQRLRDMEALAAASIEPLLEETLWRELAAARLREAGVGALDEGAQLDLDRSLDRLR